MISRNRAEALTVGSLEQGDAGIRPYPVRDLIRRGNIKHHIAGFTGRQRQHRLACADNLAAEALTAVMMPSFGERRRVQPRLSRALRSAASLLFQTRAGDKPVCTGCVEFVCGL